MLRDLIFSLIILSGIAGNLLDIRLLFPTAECASIVSKASLSESSVYLQQDDHLIHPFFVRHIATVSMPEFNLRNVLS